MVADSCHREKNVQNREKTFGIEKKNLEYRKMFQGQKKKKNMFQVNNKNSRMTSMTLL